MNQETVRLLLLDGVEDRRQELYGRLANFTDLVVEAPDEPIDPSTFFQSNNSQVVLLDSGYLGDGYGFGAALIESLPEKSVLLLEDDPSLSKMKQALVAGFSDVISSDITSEELMETILRSQLSKKHSIELLREEKNQRIQNSHGKIITVFSTKGGVGCTFTALNLAVLLKQKSNAKVALVDLDVDYGTLSAAMGLKAKTTINDVLSDLRNLDRDLLDSYLLTHDSGVRVLAAASEPQLDNYTNAEQVEIILRTIQDNYNYIVVDMPARFMEMATPAFTMASQVYMITTPEILALSNVKAGLGLLKDLNFPAARVKIILNRLNRKGLSKADVEKSLETNVFVSVPEDPAVATSLNLGTPYVLTNPRSKTTKALNALVEGLITQA